MLLLLVHNDVCVCAGCIELEWGWKAQNTTFFLAWNDINIICHSHSPIIAVTLHYIEAYYMTILYWQYSITLRRTANRWSYELRCVHTFRPISTIFAFRRESLGQRHIECSRLSEQLNATSQLGCASKDRYCLICQRNQTQKHALHCTHYILPK